MARRHQTEEADHGLQYDELPRLLCEIADVVGLPATIQLVARYGGTTILIPSTARNNNQLAQMLGPETAAKLVRRYAGTKLYISKTDYPPRATRDIEMGLREVVWVILPDFTALAACR